WPENLPYITCTPYVYEAFVHLYEATGNSRWATAARPIAEFVADDIRDTPTGPSAAAASYSPIDNGKVVNARSYRAFVVFDAAHRFGSDRFAEKAERNLNFILQAQRSDG